MRVILIGGAGIQVRVDEFWGRVWADRSCYGHFPSYKLNSICPLWGCQGRCRFRPDALALRRAPGG